MGDTTEDTHDFPVVVEHDPCRSESLAFCVNVRVRPIRKTSRRIVDERLVRSETCYEIIDSSGRREIGDTGLIWTGAAHVVADFRIEHDHHIAAAVLTAARWH